MPAMFDAAPSPPIAEFFKRPWEDRMAFVLDTMRKVSNETEPEGLVNTYSERMQSVVRSHRNLSLSRRDLRHPQVRITRSNAFDQPYSPWKQKHMLPLIEGGILSELIYGDKPVLINDLRVDASDPAAAYFEGMRSLAAIPLYDGGSAVNMVVFARRDTNGYAPEHFPEHVWLSNLFGRATAHLVLKEELGVAYASLDKELKVVADIQRSLLPTELPRIEGMDIAASYQTSQWAGGDYYDFFPLPGGKLGILIADVSGHGTPAAVMMAVTHSIAHTLHDEPTPPSKLLNFINRHLSARYTNGTGTFVTAFYGIYDPARRELLFANAGHNPPRLKRGRGGPNGIIEGDSNLPLGIDETERYVDSVQKLCPDDLIVFYTDGITEARAPDGELFGTERLDEVINTAEAGAQKMIDRLNAAVGTFTNHGPPNDDRTVLVICVS
ncbi:MAG TPA: PP2C family protein-serine/threonine phosphatase [Tepidisphaeraceae bacterium]|jgi:sigma-B regulation protein RsbU (phosphoserine phosphatase)